MTQKWMFVLVGAIAFCVGVSAQEVGKKAKLDGYAEWLRADLLIVDGQRVRANASTKFKGKRALGIADIQLGDEIRLSGVRDRDGAVLANEIEAKEDGKALFEDDVLAVTDEMEELWVEEGMMFESSEDGEDIEIIGELITSGPQPRRAQRITQRLLPPYVSADDVRVYVVDSDEWNAAAMGNGALWIYSGLLDNLSDDELAVIIGHELAHYTHEHSRRGAKSDLWMNILGLTLVQAAEAIDNEVLRATAQIATLATMTGALSKYSRNHEDQADRVGLRYVHEAGYDVRQGPRLWERFRKKYGDGNKLLNFFMGGHSRPSERARNLERELALNYR